MSTPALPDERIIGQVEPEPDDDLFTPVKWNATDPCTMTKVHSWITCGHLACRSF